MIKIYEKKDLKKFCIKKHFANLLQKIYEKHDYLEFSNGETFYLGLKDPSKVEVICLETEKQADFLRKARDNFKEVVASIKKKNILQKIQSNSLLGENSIYSKIVDLKIKTQMQLVSFGSKLQNLSKRLQNVFVVSDNFTKLAKTFDNENLLVVIPDFSDCFHPVLNELRNSKVIVFVNEKSVPYKKLKSLGFNTLSLKKESMKYVWCKNIDASQFAEVEV